jgi:ubiquinol-cytochrome c reductase cytochrome c subunit
MRRVILCTAALYAATTLSAGTAAQPAALSPSATHGRQLYTATGCYECHGYSGQGSAGPRLAPNPLPLDIFTRQLRNPRAVMPIYTRKTLSDADLADIYAYLNAIPAAKPVASIPLLK